MTEKYLPISEIAKRCKSSLTSVHNWIKNGLPFEKSKLKDRKTRYEILFSDVIQFKHWRRPRFLVTCDKCGYMEYRNAMVYECANCDNRDVEFRRVR